MKLNLNEAGRMKKSYYPLSWSLLILLVLTISLWFLAGGRPG